MLGVDLSPAMIACAAENARAHAHAIPVTSLRFAVDSVTTLATVPSESVDLIVSNYVLMDTPDLAGCAQVESPVVFSILFLMKCHLSSASSFSSTHVM